MRFPTLCTAALGAAAFLSPVQAQMKVFGGPDPDRKASTVVMFGDDAMAGISISYSSPDWKDEYNTMMDKLKGKNVRLGKNWWTSLDTSTALEIAGSKIEPGSYYLGLQCDKDGAFQLLVLDAKQAMKTNSMPFMEDAWKAETKVALKLSKDSLKEAATKMVIEIKAQEDNPSSGRFSIRWGKHELAADVKIHVPGAAKDAGAKKEKI